MAEQNKELMPWEDDWRASPVAPPQESPLELMPWEDDWGGDREDTLRQDVAFESVFENLISAESRGRHRTSSGGLLTSPGGAQGITQVMPATGRNPGYGITPLRDDSEEEYVRFGQDYLRAMLNEFNGDYAKAVAAYNAGAGSVKNAVRKGGDNWVQHLPKKSETIPYLEKILGEKFG